MSWRRQYDGPDPVRVNKWLAQSGVCSRREAEALIAAGRVEINGARVEDLGRVIRPGEVLTIAVLAGAGARFTAGDLLGAVTVVLNKPVGYVSAQPERGQVPAARLLRADRYVGEAPLTGLDLGKPFAPLGRLDQDSRGLLLLSTDGVLAKAVIGPQSRLDKEYVVTLRGEITKDKLKLLRHGLHLDGRALLPAKVAVIRPQTLQFVLQEGRNRQIRRMAAAVGLDVLDLLRVRIGPLKLNALPEGHWRLLGESERSAMIAAA